MSLSNDSKLTRYLEGFIKQEVAQEPPGRDGDPQLAALRQFLQILVENLDSDDVILDVGSGRGILADSMQQIWQDKSRLPWYYAVDLENLLNGLNLPYEIHNHSQKILFSDFINGNFPCRPQQIKIVVIRNTFHELNVKTTAEVLVALRRIIHSGGGQVYLQDMVSLPIGERANAGWHPDLLKTVLEKAGFDSGSPTIQSSHSGTKWFNMILKEKTGFPIPSIADTARSIAHGRKQQIQRCTTRLREISDSTEETASEYIKIMAEVTALTTQLQQTHYGITDENSTTEEVAELPLTAFSSSLDYAEEMQSGVRQRSGLSGILSSKNLINLPTLLDRAVGRLWFAGYSQRLLFTIPEVRAALMNAVSRKVDIRVLLVDPESPAGQARSVSEAYTKSSDFFDDVLATIQQYTKFKEEANELEDSINIRCNLRLCKSLLSASYFFVDDLCICSLYSSNLTGGAGAAFVFKSSSVQSNGYFQVLLREFQSAWGSE